MSAMVLLLPAAVGTMPLLPQMAVATSLAAAIPTTLAALAAQHRRRTVDSRWLARLAPGVCLGALLGAMAMPRIDARGVAALFVAYASYFALRLLLAAQGRSLPAPWLAWLGGLVAIAIGAVSVLAGVGGAIFTVPYVESRQLPMGAAAVVTAPLGVRVARRVPIAALKRAFARLLVLAASGSVWQVVMTPP